MFSLSLESPLETRAGLGCMVGGRRGVVARPGARDMSATFQACLPGPCGWGLHRGRDESAGPQSRGGGELGGGGDAGVPQGQGECWGHLGLRTLVGLGVEGLEDPSHRKVSGVAYTSSSWRQQLVELKLSPPSTLLIRFL